MHNSMILYNLRDFIPKKIIMPNAFRVVAKALKFSSAGENF